ncbi:MAG: DUF72 domain-containing protein [Hyphomicrobiaceae bacterium]
MGGSIRVGIGGWTFEPWRGTFYPEGLAHKRELEFAASVLTTIEINGTYYSTFKPASWRKWRQEAPDGFKFAVKASRYCTNRKVLAEAGPSVERFLAQGLVELGDSLGPINWQFMATKKFDYDDFAAFLDMLPPRLGGLPLTHALEVRHASFSDERFITLARERHIAIVVAEGEDVPRIEAPTAGFTYARIMTSREDVPDGIAPREISAIAKTCRTWARGGDVYAYFIAGAKQRNPAAAQALLRALAK